LIQQSFHSNISQL